MNRNIVETLMGALVIVVAISFVALSYSSGNIETKGKGYFVTAKFLEIGSISKGSDVRVSGIKIGTVTGLDLDKSTYQAIVKMNIKQDVKLPLDSSAAIVSDSLLGGKYIMIEPGGEEKLLSNNSVVQYTQDSVSLESLIGKFAFGSADGDDDDSDNSEL